MCHQRLITEKNLYHPLSKSHLYCVLKMGVSFRDEYGKEHACFGTAFFIKSGNGRLFVATNRHVLDAAYSDRNKRNWVIFKISLQGYTENQFEKFEIFYDKVSPLFPENYDTDVAIFDVTELDFNGDLPGSVVPVMEEYLADRTEFDNLDVMDAVAFPFLHGEKQTPIMRTGWISSDPSRDFHLDSKDDAPRIAIEGFSWNGYSGAPVFTLDRGIQSGEGVLYGGGFRGSKMIGINAGHINSTEVYGHHSGVSYLYKSTVLLELMRR